MIPKKITKEIYNKLFPIGSILPWTGKRLKIGSWRICNGKNGMPNLEGKMDKNIISRWIMRVK